MPTYEYVCKDCGQKLEVVQAFSDDPLLICTVCGGSLRKVFGNIGIAFKGSGFYKTDNRPKQPETAGSTSKDSGRGDKPEPSKGSDAKEAKPAASGDKSGTKESKSSKPDDKSRPSKAPDKGNSKN